jgi:putative component of toxin-antitoxin plasmid stabilization module
MSEIRTTEAFAKWLDTLRDLRGRARLQARIERPAMGNPGDVRPGMDHSACRRRQEYPDQGRQDRPAPRT